MSNRTAIILIPPLYDTNEFLTYCNSFFETEVFQFAEMPFFPNILRGEFSYLDLDKFNNYLQQWFSPKPIYEVADEAEKPTEYLSQMYIQTNERWGTIQLIVRREHDGRFWICNITKSSVEEANDSEKDTE